MIPAPAWTPTNAEYHASPGWSSSSLKTFRESPSLAFQRYVARSEDAPAPSGAMLLGSAVGLVVLDPDGAHGIEAGGSGTISTREVHVVNVGTRGAKSFREAEAAFPRRLVLTRTEWDEARRIADSILERPTRAAALARRLLRESEGYSEYAHRWEYQADGGLVVPCRSMVDRLSMVHSYPTIAELKTSKDPSPQAFAGRIFRVDEEGAVIEFNRRGQAHRNDYHCQAAFNVRGITDALGGVVPALYFVVVRNAPPYEVAVYRAGDGFLAEGSRQVDRDLESLATCLEDTTGAAWATPWETLSDGAIPTIEAPYG